MTFIQSLLLDPVNTMRSYPTKKIDVMSHDFDIEPLPERIHSLYSVLCGEVQNLEDEAIFKLRSYKDELEFNKPKHSPKSTDIKGIRAAWSQLMSKERNLILEKILV